MEQQIIEALEEFYESNNIEKENKFRKEFHQKFFEKMKEKINNNASKLGKNVTIKYGLIHNSIHAKDEVYEGCEIADFLFVAKRPNNDYGNAVLIQVKSGEGLDNNKSQQNLYANWKPFFIKSLSASPRHSLISTRASARL